MMKARYFENVTLYETFYLAYPFQERPARTGKLGMIRDRGPSAFNFPTGFRAVSRKAKDTLMHDAESRLALELCEYSNPSRCGVGLGERDRRAKFPKR
jgi:hypothetical protein